MQITQTLVAAILAATAFAAPAPAAEASKSMMADAPQWTMENFKRVCNTADTTCTYTFKINTTGSSTVNCKYVHNGKPASKTSGGPATCGKFAITSGWSGQFGADKGFTTLSVVQQETRQIIWPAYTDKQLAGGKVVTPNQAYAPQSLPN